MNKELIRKYHTEFTHWLNGGELLYSSIDLEDGKRTKWKVLHFSDKWEFHNAHSYAFIINDEYVEFRKALAEGKTVQYNPNLQCHNRWDDIKSISPSCTDSIKNYRIKPEEPKFKVGDWVQQHYTNPPLIGKIIKLDVSQAFIKWTIGESWKSFDKLMLWYPQVGAILAYPNGHNGASIGRLVTIEAHPEERITLAIFENGDSYDIIYCEPFVDKLPSFIKA